MHNPATIIKGYVLEQLSGEPIQKRILLTRALAEFSASNEERLALEKMAKGLELIERQHKQLLLNFRGGAE